MPKFVVRMTHGVHLEAGEVIKETGKTFVTDRVEGGVFGCRLGGRVPKDEVVFSTDNKNEVLRLMAMYYLLYKQHTAVVDAANNAFRDGLAVLVYGRKNGGKDGDAGQNGGN